MPATTSTQLLLRPPEATAMLAISARTLAGLTKSGKVPHVRLGARGVRYPVKALEQWIEKQQSASSIGGGQ